MKKYIVLVLFSIIALTSISENSFAQSSLALKICSNSAKSTLVARVKCKKGETALSPTSFTGPAGLQGPQGASGARGESAFDNIPSGKTVFGVIGYDGYAAAPNDFNAYASLPAKISQLLTDADILVAPVDIATNDCAGLDCRSAAEVSNANVCLGSAASPSAPSGKVCIYLGSISSARITAASISADLVPTTGVTPTITPGFLVSWSAAAVGDVYLKGTWAYTAP